MMRIALVEDNADNRMLVQAILDGLYEIDEYESGPQALEGIRRQRPALVLLDISLPGMDGVAVLQEIRHDPDLATLPVVALTAHAMAGDRQKYLDAGFDDYVAKPIVDDTLLTGVISWLIG
jgi:two-component system sensor histidine kinase/response regulator